MYFLGQVAATAPTSSALLTDIIGMLTGTITTTAGLTAGNFQGTPKLVTTVAPGWTSYDTAAGTATFTFTPRVIQAVYSDDGTKFKNIYISALSATSIGLRGYETWNSSTHVGTNPHVLPVAASTSSLTWVAGSWFVISASATHLLVIVYGSTFGVSASHYFATEYSRDDPWNTVANGYPSWISSGTLAGGGTAFMSHSRIYNSSTAADVASVAWGTTAGSNIAKMVTYCPIYNGAESGQSGLEFACAASNNLGNIANGADSSKVSGYTLAPLRLSSWNVGQGVLFWGSITTKTPYMYAFRGVWVSGDEVDVGVNRYFIANLNVSTTNLAIKQV